MSMLRPNGILFSLLFSLYSLNALAGPVGKSNSVKKADPNAPALVGCQPNGTPKDNFILCQGTDLNGVAAGNGDDQITIALDALVTSLAFDPKPWATAIDGGAGNDLIINKGDVFANATSFGNNLTGNPGSGSGKSKGRAAAADAGKMATAIAIDGGSDDDAIFNFGSATARSLATANSIGGGGLGGGASDALARSVGLGGGDGNDTIFNSGIVTAISDAAAKKAGSSSGGGVSSNNDSSTAQATAIGIDGGTGADNITNNSVVAAVATADIASAGSPGEDASALKSSPDSGNTAEATAAGISGGDENDTITNRGSVLATASADSKSLTLVLSANGASGADTTSTAKASATALDAGAGDDDVLNEGNLVATAISAAAGLGGVFTDSGGTPWPKSSWKGGATAETSAVGIGAGAGDDTVNNSGAIVATATSLTATATIAASASDMASAASDAKAVASAIGIDAGDGDDTLTNSGSIVAVATATAGALDIAFSQNGKARAAHKGGANAEASAVGVSADGSEDNKDFSVDLKILPHSLTQTTRLETLAPAGNDTVTNSGAITAVATAIAGTESGAVSISGAATSDMSSAAKSTATGIDAGAGNDAVTNSGSITAVSTATAGAIGIGFSESGKAAVKGGPSAEAIAIGISADGTRGSTVNEATLEITLAQTTIGLSRDTLAPAGTDTISNSGEITAVASAVSGSAAGAISISGAASVETKSSAKALATGIDLGGGDDTLTNSGAITAVSTAAATAVGFAFSESDEAKVEGGPESEAMAIGISGDGTLVSSHIGSTLTISVDGVSTGLIHEKTASVGADTIDNSGAVTAVASAVSGSAAGSISISGEAAVDASSEAKALAATLDAGGGDDTITNSGALTAIATAAAGTVGIGFSESKKGEAKANATAEAEAFGIRGDGIEASNVQEATLAIGSGQFSAGLRIEKTASSGTDTIINNGAVTVVATALSGSETVAASIKEAASAEANSTASALAVGVDAGAGDDTVDNNGALTSVATATALTLAAGISEEKAGAASATATSEARAIGISGDGVMGSMIAEASLAIVPNTLDASFSFEKTGATGTDDISNDSALTVVATALSGSGALGASIKGAASADATSHASAAATGIDAGGGDDTVTNTGVLTSVSTATAGELSAAISGKGSATSIKSLWQGGSSAEAMAKGITGDSTDREFSTETILAINTEEKSVEATSKSSFVQAGGDDTITNSGVVTATALATTPSVDVTVALDGMAAAVTTSEASASTMAIDGGTGDDTILNQGVLTSSAVATAATVNIAVSPKGSAVAADSIWDGGTKADAVAIGISGDGEGQEWSAEGSIKASESLVQIDAAFSSTMVGGDDDINNDGTVVVTSVALVPTLTVAVPVKGAGAAISASTATSYAAGIDAGSGDDVVLNQGELISSSIAVAAAANVAVSKNAVLAGNTVWDGGTTAEAKAVGISGDGEGRDLLKAGTVVVTPDAVLLAGTNSSSVVSGEDEITNQGTLVVSSFAEVPSLSVGVTSKGVAAAISTATAKAQSVGIDAGAGDDIVSNTATITSTAIANANVLNVAVTSAGVAVAADAFWEGGATAGAEAVGINGDGEGEEFLSQGRIEAGSDAVRLSSQQSYTAVSGDDEITNDGVITASALSAALSLGVAVTPSGGLSVAITEANAGSRSAAIKAGSGDDNVENDGVLTSTSLALAGSASVAYVSGGVAIAGNSVWEGGTTADADAVGIDGDGEGRDLVINSDIEVAGGDVRISSEYSDKTVSGDDIITNRGVITASSFAESASAGVSVTLSGGVSAAVSTSTAIARAVGIDGGSGDDTIDNTGVVTASAVANANALTVAYATAGVAIASDAVMDGGTTASAEAVGIEGDGEGRDLTIEGLIEVTDAGTFISGRVADEVVAGDDTITNDSVVTASAVALAPSLGVAVTPAGLSVAVTTATAKARAAAIDAGSGDDTVDNTGTLTATSAAIAAAVPIAVTPAGVAVATDAVWDGGTKAEAEAVGISGDGTGMDHVSEASILASGGAVSIEASDVYSVVSGDDTITNDGRITATAVAEALSAAVSVTPAGLAVSIATSTAKSRAAGIDAGSGDDVVDNSGKVVAVAVANANAVSVSVTPAGVAVASDAVWDGGTHGEADAVGIAGDGEGRDDTTEFSIAVNDTGINIHASDRSEVVSGDDTITNSGEVTATAIAVVPSIGVAVVPAGVSVALSTATSRTRAVAIDAGSGDDFVDNTGALHAVSSATSVAIPVAVTPAGVAIAADAVWDGGTEAEAEAVGISGDGVGTDFSTEFGMSVDASGIRAGTLDTALVVSGDDTILNKADVVATAVAVSTSIGVSVTPAGVSVSASTATAKSRAAAIDAGSGDDIVENEGHLTAGATSVGVAIPVAVAPIGFAVAADAIWDGGTKADAEAVGIDGDGRGTDFSTENSIESNLAGTLIRRQVSSSTVSGDDTITNTARIEAGASAVAPSVAFSLGVVGGVSAANATSQSYASAIDAGAGHDDILNQGHITADAVANADGIAISLGAIAVSGNAVWDGGTTAEAEAVGISGDGRGDKTSSEFTIASTGLVNQVSHAQSTHDAIGNDIITNQAQIDADAKAVAVSVSFASGAITAAISTSTAEARAASIDAGAGDDVIDNSGTLKADADATSVTTNVSWSGGVAAALDSVWDGGTTAEAEAVGITSDGQGAIATKTLGVGTTPGSVSFIEHSQSSDLYGNDDIFNTGSIEATASASATSVAASLSMLGSVSVATSTAQSRAAAIEAGGGDDIIVNDANLITDASSVATSVNVTLSAGISASLDAIWDGGTTAEVTAVGIDGDGQGGDVTTDKVIEVSAAGVARTSETVATNTDGDDIIINTASINSNASATSTSVGAAVSVVGVAAAISTSTAQTRSTAIRGGGGDDTIDNQGVLTATSVADADGVSVSVTGGGASVAADAFWDGGTSAEAISSGIDGGAGNDVITNSSSIHAMSIADAGSTSVAATVAGIAGSISASTADALATAIKGADGDDTIDNSGNLEAISSATARATSVSVGLIGFASTDTSAIANARAIGIDTGNGTDVVSNNGDILAGASATATGADVTVELLGAGFADTLFEGEIRADAHAAGLVGGEDVDDLTNDGVIALGSNAEISAKSASVGLVGFADADTSATASAQVSGMVGGAADDILNNRGAIAGSAISNAPARSVSVELIGASSADAHTSAEANALGMDGGTGTDGLYNLGAIDLVAQASAEAKSGTVTLAGAAHANADANANVEVSGMDGDDGDDEVFNFGTIILAATAEARAFGTSIDIFGVASQTARTVANAFATGLKGGGGDDLIANAGTLQVEANANATVSNAAWTLAGASEQQGLLGAEAQAIGMAGGGGVDVLFNEGTIDVDVNSQLGSSGTVGAVFGAGSANASLDGTLSAWGISGGEDDDQLINAGLVSVNSILSAASTGTAWNLFGTAGVSAGMSSDTALFGLAGGSGDDLIANAGTLQVAAQSVMTASSSSWTFGGASNGAGALSSVTAATGVSGDEGADWLHNEGQVDVLATSALSASGGSKAIFGKAGTAILLRAQAFAVGMDGGDGDDTVENLSDIHVDAVATLSSTSAAFTFIGGASSGADLSALVEARGLVGGSGSDELYNGGSVLVSADASNTGAGGAQTLIGGANAGATTVATARAFGVSGDAGDDLVVNTGLVSATANADPRAISDASTGGFYVDGVTRSRTNAVVETLGAGLGSGENAISNYGNLWSVAGGSGLADAASTGSPLSLSANASADAISAITASRARGIAAGDDANEINNQGIIDVTMTIAAASTADADGAGLVGGNGNAYAQANADVVKSIGIDVGHGDNLIANGGEITVRAMHEASATSYSDADGLDFFTAPSSAADTLTSADSTLAIGIRAGDGDNTIWNDGTISVYTAPEARAVSWALFQSRNDSQGRSLAVDAFGDAETSVNNAFTFGILAGDGANEIHNTGEIAVTSAPFAYAKAHSAGRGWDGDAESVAMASANGALAVGIYGGDGGNLIFNEGTISALSNPRAQAITNAIAGGAELAGAVEETLVCSWKPKWAIFNWILTKVCHVVKEIADGVIDDGETVSRATAKINNAEAIGIRTGAGDDVVVNKGSINAQVTGAVLVSASSTTGSTEVVVATAQANNPEAIGILTGAGNDEIINEGSIYTWVKIGALDRAGIAIRSGTGNDTVILKDGSSLVGDVDLGADDDDLYLLGAPQATGHFYGGTGSDALFVDGSSQLFGGAFGFEALTLYGSSSFTLNALGSVESLGVYEGTLNVQGNYGMAPAGTFNVHINADGSHGQLAASGTVALGGALEVSNGSGPYFDGTTWDVVSAGTVSGVFASQDLPAPTALVSFGVVQDAATVNVVANVLPFAVVAGSASAKAVADYLDDILPESTGDLSAVLAMMQALPEEDFGAAFASLDPGTYDSYQATDSTMRNHLAGTHNRMSSIRAALSGSSNETSAAFMSDSATLFQSMANFDAQFARQLTGDAGRSTRKGRMDAWLVNFISDGNMGADRNNAPGSNFDTSGVSLGIDYAIQDNLVAGVSYGSATTETGPAGRRARSELGSTMTSVYATYMPSEDTYIETVISRSGNQFMNRRDFDFGNIHREALSDRRSEISSTFLEAGRKYQTGSLHSELFGSLYYSSLSEDGFEEVGAGDINIIIDERRYETLSAEFGWRGSRDYKTTRGLLTPQMSATLLQNFDIGDRGMAARFAGVPDLSFSPVREGISGYGIRLGLGLNFVQENGWAVQTKVNGEISDRRKGLGGVLQVIRKF